MYLTADTLDDLLEQVFTELVRLKTYVSPSRGQNRELTGLVLRIKNPRARLSHSETKGFLFSALGEFLWYLSKRNDVNFISYYIRKYIEEADGSDKVYGGYGPRIFYHDGKIDQFENVIKTLTKNPESRRAVIQLFDAVDIDGQRRKEIPCTCTLQFLIRNSRLDMYTHMRSNDAYKGLPHDVFAFTMIQEILSHILEVNLGEYYHSVNSLHLYKDDEDSVREYLEEGYQSTEAMPPMPAGNIMAMVEKILNIEEGYRLGNPVDIQVSQLDNYWMDIAHLLQIFRLSKDRQRDDLRKIILIKGNMNSTFYQKYIRRREQRFRDYHIPEQPELPFKEAIDVVKKHET